MPAFINCPGCHGTGPAEDFAKDSVDPTLVFCSKCREGFAQSCAYCELSTKPPKITPALAGWLFGERPDQCWNPACEDCITSRKLHRRVHVERMSARYALRAVETQLRLENLQEEGLYIFDHVEEKAVLDRPLEDWRWIPCYVVTGGNEGHYVHIDVLRKRWQHIEQKTHLLASIKTFMGRRRAYEVALRCAELLGA